MTLLEQLERLSRRQLKDLDFTITEETTTLVRLGREWFLQTLRAQGLDVPDNTEIVFRVPCGGNYSGMLCDVSHDNPIYIRFKAKE